MQDPAAEGWVAGPGLMESLLRYWWLVAICVVALAAGGYAYAARQPPVYEAAVELLVADPLSIGTFRDIRPPSDPRRYVHNQAELITSMHVAERAAELLDGSLPPGEIQSRVSALPEWDIDLVVLTARGSSPEQAAAIADAVAIGYEEVVEEDFEATVDEVLTRLEEDRQAVASELTAIEGQLEDEPNDPVLHADRLAASAQLSSISERLRAVSADAALADSGVTNREPARIPNSPVAPIPSRSAGAGAIAGFVVSGGLAYLLNRRRLRRADHRQEPERQLGAPLLGEIPDFGRSVHGKVPSLTAPRSVPAEAYQFIVNALDLALRDRHFFDKGGEKHRLLVTSAEAGEGKSVTAMNLAVAASRDGRRVALLDADLRARSSAGTQGPFPASELTAVGRHDGTPWPERRSAALPNLRLVDVQAEGGEPAAFFRSAAFARTLDVIGHAVDLMIVDSPPVLAVADAAELAAHVDGAIIVVTPKTEEALLREVGRRFAMMETPVVGYVVNRSLAKLSPYAYGYGPERGESVPQVPRLYGSPSGADPSLDFPGSRHGSAQSSW